jgi:tetratricopeptide (TPR) repeat protein
LQVQVRTAQASRQSDLDAILAWIGDAHADVDKAVIAALREWLAVTAQAALDAMAEEERATSALINNLGVLYLDQGEYSLAEALYTEALAGCRRQLGDDHPDTLTSMNNLGLLYQHQGKFAEAEELYTEALAATRRQLGDDHPSTLLYMNNLGSLYQQQGKHARPTWMPDHGVTQVGAAALGPVGYPERVHREYLESTPRRENIGWALQPSIVRRGVHRSKLPST